MTRGEKRALESNGDDEEMHGEAKRPKVPALARYFYQFLSACSCQVLYWFQSELILFLQFLVVEIVRKGDQLVLIELVSCQESSGMSSNSKDLFYQFGPISHFQVEEVERERERHREEREKLCSVLEVQ